MRRYDLSRMRTLFLAGERCDPDTLAWAERSLGRPVIDHWWQTETGWAITANCVGLEHLAVRPGSSAKPVPGYDLRVLDDEGAQAPPGQIGSLCVKLPLPPGCSPTLWGSDQRWIDAYLSQYDGYYLTADAGYIDDDGYVYVMSRTDDVINTAGHLVGPFEVESALIEHPAVAEAGVIGKPDPVAMEVVKAFVTLKDGYQPDEALRRELMRFAREKLGPGVAPREIDFIDTLPKTRSGKIMRRLLKARELGLPEGDISTLEE